MKSKHSAPGHSGGEQVSTVLVLWFADCDKMFERRGTSNLSDPKIPAFLVKPESDCPSLELKDIFLSPAPA
jgi:hypothetical protein